MALYEGTGPNPATCLDAEYGGSAGLGELLKIANSVFIFCNVHTGQHPAGLTITNSHFDTYSTVSTYGGDIILTGGWLSQSNAPGGLIQSGSYPQPNIVNINGTATINTGLLNTSNATHVPNILSMLSSPTAFTYFDGVLDGGSQDANGTFNFPAIWQGPINPPTWAASAMGKFVGQIEQSANAGSTGYNIYIYTQAGNNGAAPGPSSTALGQRSGGTGTSPIALVSYMMVGPFTYASGVNVNAGMHTVSGGNVYGAENNGITGPTAPAGTTLGIVSPDGLIPVTWDYVGPQGGTNVNFMSGTLTVKGTIVRSPSGLTAAPLIVVAGANDTFINGLDVTDTTLTPSASSPLEVLNVLASYGTKTLGAQLGTIHGWKPDFFGPGTLLSNQKITTFLP